MEGLNPTQRRHLYDSLVHIERQLEGLEAILAKAAAPGLFPRYREDVPEAVRRHLAAAMRQVRARLALALDEAGLTPEAAAIGASQALRSHLSVAEIGADDVGARSMRGYGELTAEMAERLDRLATDLRQALAGLLPHEGEATRWGSLPRDEMAERLGGATDAAMERIAAALAEAAASGRSGDELPLIAGDVLTQVARQECERAGWRGQLPEVELDAIRWRLDRPRLSFGRSAMVKAFRQQLEPLREQVRGTLRSYALKLR